MHAEQSAAARSSIITPIPPGSSCSFLIPRGLAMSKIRNRTKPDIKMKTESNSLMQKI